MNVKRSKQIHGALAFLDVCAIILVIQFVLHGIPWVAFPLILNRICEVLALWCLRGERPITFSLIQPMFTIVGAILEPNKRKLVEGYIPLLCFQLLICIYVRYARILIPSVPAQANQPEGEIGAEADVTRARRTQQLHIIRAYFIVVVHPDESKSIALKYDALANTEEIV